VPSVLVRTRIASRSPPGLSLCGWAETVPRVIHTNAPAPESDVSGAGGGIYLRVSVIVLPGPDMSRVNAGVSNPQFLNEGIV
jgi:hypothetical protein